MPYPGGKGGAGVYQTIINGMPRHEVYVEPFFGRWGGDGGEAFSLSQYWCGPGCRSDRASSSSYR